MQKVDVNEPTVDDTYKILVGLKSKFEDLDKIWVTYEQVNIKA